MPCLYSFLSLWLSIWIYLFICKSKQYMHLQFSKNLFRSTSIVYSFLEDDLFSFFLDVSRYPYMEHPSGLEKPWRASSCSRGSNGVVTAAPYMDLSPVQHHLPLCSHELQEAKRLRSDGSCHSEQIQKIYL